MLPEPCKAPTRLMKQPVKVPETCVCGEPVQDGALRGDGSECEVCEYQARPWKAVTPVNIMHAFSAS